MAEEEIVRELSEILQDLRTIRRSLDRTISLLPYLPKRMPINVEAFIA